MLNDRIATLLSKEHKQSIDEVDDILTLPVICLRGIGPQYAKKLNEFGITTLSDLLNKTVPAGLIPNKLLDKWKIAVSIIKQITRGEEKEPKIIFSGLANVGKTSIINTLKNIKVEVSPTLGAKNEILNLAGNKVRVIDMGGQKKFRERYLRIPEQYFTNTQIVFYVIDVLNLDQFNESLSYFDRVLQIFRYLRLKPFFSVLFHKYDPDKAYKLKYEVLPYIEKIKAFLQRYWEFKFKVFYTSIFNPASLYVATAQTFSEAYPVIELVNNLLWEFISEKDFDGAALIDEKGVLLARAFKNAEIANEVLNQIYCSYNEIKSNGSNQSFSVIVLRKKLEQPEGGLIAQKIFLPKGIGYIFYWKRDFTELSNISELNLIELAKTLNPWLFNLFQQVRTS